MNKKCLDAISAFLKHLTDFIEGVAREAAEKRVDELRSGWVHNANFDCCPALWPWFYKTFMRDAGPCQPLDRENPTRPLRVSYRDKNVNYCPFCGAKL
jgi:hypothetical protein